MHFHLPILRKFCTSSTPPESLLLSQTIQFIHRESCTSIAQLRALHARLIVSGLAHLPSISCIVLKFYAISRFSCPDHALLYFSQLSETRPVHVNLIMQSFVLRTQPASAIQFFKTQMASFRGIAPRNEHTLRTLIKAAALRYQVYEGEMMHCLAFKLWFDRVCEVSNSLIHMYANCGYADLARDVFDEMPQRDLVSWTSMVDGYAKFGNLDDAERLFWEMPMRDVVSWNMMISRCVQNQKFETGLWVFSMMLNEFGEKPNEGTLVSLFLACGVLRKVRVAKSIHGFFIRNGIRRNVELDTSIVNCYCKCNALEIAFHVFDCMSYRNLICWNAMIVGHAEVGNCRRAIELFWRMLNEGVKPDDISYIGVLTACACAGFTSEGKTFFEHMITVHNIKPRFAHYWCLVDLYTRVGDVEKALDVVINMPIEEDDSFILGAILALARIGVNLESAEYAFRKLIELEPYNSSRYLPLMNLYSAARRWDEYVGMQEEMKKMGFQKKPRTSLIDLNTVIHGFDIGDRSNPEIQKIYSVLIGIIEAVRNFKTSALETSASV